MTLPSKAIIQNGRADKVLPQIRSSERSSSSPSPYYVKCYRDLSKKKKMIKYMKSKMTTNSNYQQLNLKQTKNQTKQTTGRGRESQKRISHGGLSVGKGGERGKRYRE